MNDNRLFTANTYILHSNKSYEKFMIGLEILNLFIDDIFIKNKAVINFEKIYNYIEKREYTIRLLFNCNKFDIYNIKNNNKDINEMIKYLNSRLRTIFNLYIKKDKKSNEYIVTGLDFWDEKINPIFINEELRTEMYIINMLKEINLDE
jgi:signal recognition particle receptor subunit beta